MSKEKYRRYVFEKHKDRMSETVFYTITVAVGVGFFRLWGIHMLCICGDGVLPKVTLNPIDSHKSMYYTVYCKVDNDHHGDLLPLGH